MVIIVNKVGDSKVAKIKPTSQRKNVHNVGLAISKTFYEYAEMSKVNGMYYLRKTSTQGFSRLIWSLIPLLLLTFAALLVFFLWKRYLESPTRMTIATPLPSLDVPFPGITVCHPQSILDYKAVPFVNRIKYPADVTKEMMLDALPSLGILTEHQWTNPNLPDVVLVNNVLKLNNISVFSAVMQLGTTCDDFIIKCRWAGTEFPCFQEHEYLTWTTSTSHFGACCSFNYHPNNIEYIPFAANSYGLDGGLTIIGTGYPQTADGKSGVLFSAGFVSLIHHPNDFAVESAPTTLLKTGTETFIAIYPTDSRCSSQVLDLPQSQRNCINAADYSHLDTYRQPACILECLRDAIHKECKCHPYHLPQVLTYGRQRQLKECTVLDALCFVNNYAKFKTLKCNCLPSCSDVSYKISSFVTTLSAVNYSTSSLYKLTNLTDFEFIAHFYIANQLVSANKRIVVMSWITLLSNLGGVFNLCLGISVISLMELFYFVGVRLRYHYLDTVRVKVHPKVIQVLKLNEANAKWQEETPTK